MSEDTDLWNAIYALYSLLSNRVNDEANYQAFFENHPAVFTSLGFDEAKSFEKASPHVLPYDKSREFRPEPDFIGISRENGKLSIVELKTPFVGSITTSRSDGNRAKLKANAESYVSQGTEYVDSIRERSDARDVVSQVLSVERIAAYELLLIYGLREENDCALVAALTSQRKTPTEILFYDSLLDRLIDRYSIARKDVYTRPGWCFVFHLVVPMEQVHQRAYLGDFGSGERNRLSIIIESHTLMFECIDSLGETHRISALLIDQGAHYVRFEFSNDATGMYMSLNVNNIEQDLRVAKKTLNFDPDISVFTLGADAQGRNGASFLLLEQYCVNRTMDISEKLVSFHYFVDKTQASTTCFEFKPECYMTRNSAGHLVQDIDELKPNLQEWIACGSA